MRKSYIFIIFVFCLMYSSCTRNACVNPWSSFKLFIQDEDYNNLLLSNSNINIISQNNDTIDFVLKNWVIDESNPEDEYHLVSDLHPFYFENCFDQDCDIIVHVSNDLIDIKETVTLSISAIREGNCYYERTEKFTVDGIQCEKHSTLGGYIIRI